MSYESATLAELRMPPRSEVEDALLKSLFRHGGTIREFSAGQHIVEEIADGFGLDARQRSAYLETIYRRENRVKRSSLWHRLLFRAADNLAKNKQVIRPTQTFALTNSREWLLTEAGYDRALELFGIPSERKEVLQVRSYEVERIAKKLSIQSRPVNYNPISDRKPKNKVIREMMLRERGFRQAVIEAYDRRCSVCGMRISSPDGRQWEVEAAHIVPHSASGKDDVFNGLALCRLHHWAFDVGWFAVSDDFEVIPSSRSLALVPSDAMKGGVDPIRMLGSSLRQIELPRDRNICPHPNSLRWHRQNIFVP